MKINPRLETIGKLVPSSSLVLDLGCDHAYLPLYLVKNRGFKKVYASDNKEGPLKIAALNIHKMNCDNNIELILAEGLDAYREGIDTLIISGMGGLSINKILLADQKKLKNFKTIILSPNNFIPAVRINMARFGFIIKDELVVKDKNIIYPILIFEQGKARYKKEDLYLGPILKNKTDSLVKEYYERERQGREQLLKMLPASYFHKKRITKKEIKWLDKVLS